MKKVSPFSPPELQVIYLAINSLQENPNNARTHADRQIAKICKSIKEFGFTNPILIDKNKMIIAGHGRYRAAKQLGLVTVPVIFLEHLTKEQVRAYVIADNKLALDAGWDEEILKIEFQNLMELDFDLSLTGFNTPEIDFVINTDFIKNEEKDKPDKADILPEENKVPQRVKAGELWQLGNHRLYCGDSLKEESFKILLGSQKANMVLADDPYNVPLNGHVCGSGKIKHSEFAMASGEMDSEQFTNFLETAFKNCVAYSTDGSLHFHYMDWRHVLEIMTAGNKAYSSLKNICIWDKQHGGMGSLYRSQHELVFVFKNGTEAHTNNIELGKHGRYRTNVWEYRGVSVTNPGSLEDLKLHPTVKPIAMLMDAILDCSKPKDIILDCFAGSGSTLLAAERTKRKAYVIEYEPKYCDVILYRYEKLFKKKVELIKNYEDNYNG